MRRRTRLLLATAVLVLAGGRTEAHAATISILRPLTLGSAAIAPSGINTSFPAFDPSLGALDSVTVLFGMAMSFEVQRQFGVETPVAFDLTVHNGLSGFEILSPGEHLKFPTLGSSGLQGNDFVEVVGSFLLSVTFDAASDVLGFKVPTVADADGLLVLLQPVIGTRAMFLNFSTETFTLTPYGDFGFRNVEGSGELRVDFNYTPAIEPGAEVPEPATALLLASGLAVARRWTKTSVTRG